MTAAARLAHTYFFPCPSLFIYGTISLLYLTNFPSSDLVSSRDNTIYYYDINPLSNFVAGAAKLLGFDPTAKLVEYIHSRLR